MRSPSDPTNLRVTKTLAGVEVHLIGCNTLNEQTSQVVKEQLVDLIKVQGPTLLLLDLSSVDLLTSDGLGMLVALHVKLRNAGGHLTLSGVKETIYEVFEVTQLFRVLDIRREGTPGPSSAG